MGLLRFAPVDNFSEVSGHFGKRRSVGRNRAGRKTNEERMVLYRRTYALDARRWTLDVDRHTWTLDADCWTPGAVPDR